MSASDNTNPEPKADVSPEWRANVQSASVKLTSPFNEGDGVRLKIGDSFAPLLTVDKVKVTDKGVFYMLEKSDGTKFTHDGKDEFPADQVYDPKKL